MSSSCSCSRSRSPCSCSSSSCSSSSRSSRSSATNSPYSVESMRKVGRRPGATRPSPIGEDILNIPKHTNNPYSTNSPVRPGEGSPGESCPGELFFVSPGEPLQTDGPEANVPQGNFLTNFPLGNLFLFPQGNVVFLRGKWVFGVP